MSYGPRYGNVSEHTLAVTMGVTEEMQDSVHSLEHNPKGYYEWKQENVPRQKIRESNESLNESVVIEPSPRKNTDETLEEQARQRQQQREEKRKSQQGHYLRDSLENQNLLKAG